MARINVTNLMTEAMAAAHPTRTAEEMTELALGMYSRAMDRLAAAEKRNGTLDDLEVALLNRLTSGFVQLTREQRQRKPDDAGGDDPSKLSDEELAKLAGK